jgi:hypothetical protein
LIPGGHYGEEEKESSSEEDQAEEEEVGVCRFKIFDSLNTSGIASRGSASAGE